MSAKKVTHHIPPYVQKFGALGFLVLVFLGIAHVWANSAYDVTWGIATYESDVYDMDDLTFVWEGEIGNATSTQITGCSTGNCFFNTSYNELGTRSVTVFAKNTSGERVSNIATCSADVQQECPCALGYVCVNNRCVYDMEVSCAGYETTTATNPALFFDPGASVYWKPTVIGGTAPYRYSWTIQTESDTVRDTRQVSGPYYTEDIPTPPQTPLPYDYKRQESYTAQLAVRDANNKLESASCIISVKQCRDSEDCANLGFPSNYYCDQSTFTCVPPGPVFIKTLAVTQGVVNQGQQCNLSWEVENATRCDVYRNDKPYPFDGSTATTSFMVVPGTYYIQCTNAVDEIITAGPAQCIYNPEIRES